MNRSEFIKILRRELSKLPQDEIDAAVEYYEEYFDDAGPDRVDELIQEFGSPKKIAAQIKAEYAARKLDEEDASTAKKGVSAIWIVILGICSAPVSLPVAVVLVALTICGFAIALSVVVAIFAVIIGAVAAALGMLIMGVLAIPVSLATALLFIGGGIVLLAVFATVGVLAVIGVKKAVSVIVRSVRKHNERKEAERKCVE